MPRDAATPPPGARTATVRHRVAFFETDAMGVAHHANHLRWFEVARVAWLDEHDQPYTRYVEQDLHFATTWVEVRYHRGARFDDTLAITTWAEWIRGASLRMAYRITLPARGDELVASGATEHAAVDSRGRLRRLPRERRFELAATLGSRPRAAAEHDPVE
jgi:acyl-CoA thioester hydrolase